MLWVNRFHYLSTTDLKGRALSSCVLTFDVVNISKCFLFVFRSTLSTSEVTFKDPSSVSGNGYARTDIAAYSFGVMVLAVEKVTTKDTFN